MDELTRQKAGKTPEPTPQMSTEFFDEIYKLWEDGESPRAEIQKYYDYWDGKIGSPVFDDMKYTPVNVIGEILEAVLNNVLDAQFTMGVNPVLNSFADISTLKDQQAIADIYNQEMENVLKHNGWDAKKETIGRWGLIKFGASQVQWDDTERKEGEIKLDDIDPRNLRWNRGAKKWRDLTYIGYVSELNPGKVKSQYARSTEGVWDTELCAKIDDLAETETNVEQGGQKGVVNYTNKGGDLDPALSGSGMTGQAFAYDSKGLSAGKIVKVVVLFLLDDTLYAPEEGKNQVIESDDKTYQQKYPNGRMIVFSAQKDKKVILEDRAISESFKGLGNVDFFNALGFDELIGRGIIKPLIPIQNRINGGINKMRMLIKGHIKKLGVDRARFPELTENAFVDNDVAFIEGLAGEKQDSVLSSIINDTMPDVAAVWEQIKAWKQQAYDVARINPTLINGTRQTGTNSAEQVEALQEGPTTTIRGIQRNFKNYAIQVGNKIVSLIHNNYNVDRLIECTTGTTGNAKYAKISVMPGKKDENGKQAPDTREMVLYNEAMEEVRKLKVNPDWEYTVDVSAGTDIPRSRRELATLTEKNFKDGVLGDMHDIDVKEQYLRAQDYPNWRAFITLMRKKQEDAAKAPMYPKLDKVMNSEILAKSVSDIITALAKAGMTTDIAAMLKVMGLTGKVDNLTTAPVQGITSKSQVADVATILPHRISDNPQEASQGSEVAEADKIIKGLSPEQLGRALAYLSTLQAATPQGGGTNG